jgi:hypothetical protein
MNLAKLEAQIFLKQFIEALPDWDVVEPVDYGKNYAVRGPSAGQLSAP